MKLYYLICGYRKITFDMSDSATVLNICMRYRYPYRQMTMSGDKISIIMTEHTASRLVVRCAEHKIKLDKGETKGLPGLAFRYRKRFGLMLGALLAALIVYMSGRVVWDIRVVGAEQMSDDEVESVLAECGFERGLSLNGFNADKTEIDALLKCERLAWISINMKGTVAYVEVREKQEPNESENPSKPANVVASRAGKIIEMIAYDGMAAVKAGDEVKEGDLLISGVYGDKAPGVLVTRAAGYVKARTFHSFEVTIPLEYEKKVYTGVSKSEKYIIFFSKPIKVFINSGNLSTICDKIEEEKCLSLFGVRLPVEVCSTTFNEYETVTAYYSVDEAKALAAEQLRVTVATELGHAEILSQTQRVEIAENSVTLYCDIFCIEDIAKIQEFDLNY